LQNTLTGVYKIGVFLACNILAERRGWLFKVPLFATLKGRPSVQAVCQPKAGKNNRVKG